MYGMLVHELMFHEDFVLFPKDDDPAGEYIDDDGIIKIYLPHIYGYEELEKTITHEWLHALFEWADEENWDSDGDHYIIRSLGYD